MTHREDGVHVIHQTREAKERKKKRRLNPRLSLSPSLYFALSLSRLLSPGVYNDGVMIASLFLKVFPATDERRTIDTRTHTQRSDLIRIKKVNKNTQSHAPKEIKSRGCEREATGQSERIQPTVPRRTACASNRGDHRQRWFGSESKSGKLWPTNKPPGQAEQARRVPINQSNQSNQSFVVVFSYLQRRMGEERMREKGDAHGRAPGRTDGRPTTAVESSVGLAPEGNKLKRTSPASFSFIFI